MANDLKVIKADDVVTSAKRLKEAARQMVGQADRTNNLFVDVLCEIDERLQAIEPLVRRWAEAEKRLAENQPARQAG